MGKKARRQEFLPRKKEAIKPTHQPYVVIRKQLFPGKLFASGKKVTEWYWKLRAGNGQSIAQSTRGYRRPSEAKRAFLDVAYMLSFIGIKDESEFAEFMAKKSPCGWKL